MKPLAALPVAFALLVLHATQAAGEVTVAVAGPAEGRLSDRTNDIAAGARAAIDVLNAAGGINGEHVALKTVDDGCASASAETVAAQLAAETPSLVIGHPCPRAALAAATTYGKAGILFIATATRHADLTAKRPGATVFRLSGRDDQQGAAAGALLSREFKGERIALIQDRTRYARTLADAASDTIEKATGKPPVIASIIGGDKEYKATVAKTKSAAAIFFAGFPIEAGFVHAALRQAGSTAQFFGSDALATDEFAETFGDGAKGVRVLGAAMRTDKVSAGQRSAATTADSRDIAALNDEARARAAVLIFADAARQAGTFDSGKIADVLSTSEFKTDIGDVRFDAAGDANLPAFAVLEWSGNAWTIVGATPAAPVVPPPQPSKK